MTNESLQDLGESHKIRFMKLEKLHSYLNVNEEQQGFHPNWLITDTVFIVQIIKKEIEYNKALCVSWTL